MNNEYLNLSEIKAISSKLIVYGCKYPKFNFNSLKSVLNAFTSKILGYVSHIASILSIISVVAGVILK